MTHTKLCVKSAVLCLIAFSPVYAVSFQSLGPVDVYTSMSSSVFAPVVVSGDGSTVAATSGGRGFTWTAAEGKTPFGGLYGSFPTSMSYNGAAVVGGSQENEGWRPAIWNNGTKTRIYVMPEADRTYATAVSADGQTVLGIGSNGVFKWRANSVWDIGGLSIARGMSADATTISSNITRTVPPGDWDPVKTVSQAVVWKDGVVTSLGTVSTDPAAFSHAWSISPDGNVVFGYASATSIYGQPFRWTAEGGMVGLGVLPGAHNANDYEWMKTSNYDGSVLAGCALFQGASRATIWDAQHGLRLLDEVLSSQYGIDLTGWTLQEATGMSWDGQTIAGYGINPQGIREGWAVSIPEPATIVLVAMAFAGLARRRADNNLNCPSHQ